MRNRSFTRILSLFLCAGLLLALAACSMPPPETPAHADAVRVWQYCGVWSPDHLLGHVRNVTYRNIQILADEGVPVPDFVFNSADETHYIDGVTIENVTLNGKPLQPHVIKNEYTRSVTVL